MNNHPIQNFMATAMSSIKEMVDVNTIIGDPITTTDGTTIIPVSKVSFGFVTGGSDIPVGATAPTGEKPFGGAAASGVSVMPIAFLVVTGGTVKILSVSNSITTVDKVIELIPDVMDRVKTMIENKKPEEAQTEVE